MNFRKRIGALALGLTLAFSQTAYAEVLIPPISSMGSSKTLPSPIGETGQGTSQGTAQETAAGTGAQAQQETSPSGISAPVVSAEGAVLLDSASGKVLFGKNEDKQFYPASITKIMTALIVLERCSLSDVVTFSASATSNLEAGAVSLGITEGDQLTVEQCLYGLLLKSANEIGNGLAEHVAGSVSAFADLMNAKAAELGCKNTHFANPHGLNDANHVTTAYDMALIMRAALKNQTFRKIDTTTSYPFPATKKAAAKTITMGHKMMYPTDSRYYEGIVGGKTGYTSKAGNTLVTAAERNGVQLIAVVMKASGSHYTDTKAMLDYGFANYAALTGGGGDAAAQSGSQTQSGPGVQNEPQTEQTGPGASGGSSVQASSQPGGAAGENGNQSWGWRQDTTGRYYIKSDGKLASNQWLTLDGRDYWFDSNSYAATGWRNFTNGAWYYFDPTDSHAVTSGWVQDGGAWYYLGSDGVLLTSTVTPDGYRVDENGIWIS